MEQRNLKYCVLRRKADRVFLRSQDAWGTEIADAHRFDGEIEAVSKSVKQVLEPMLKSGIRFESDYEIVQVDASFLLAPLGQPPETEIKREPIRTPWGNKKI